MAKFTVVYDACVLYPKTLRDLLMHLATANLFKAKWSRQIHDEWMRNLHEDKPDISMESLERVRDLMDSYVLDGLVTGFEPLIEILDLPDLDDRHVLAAAIVGRADAIITFNLKHFPASALQPYGIEAIHPDKFICAQFDLKPAVVCRCVKTQREALKKPPRTVEEHLARLEAAQLPQAVALLRDFPNDI